MEKPIKKSLFKNRSEQQPKSSKLRTGRNGLNVIKKEKTVNEIPKENPLLSQAPEGSKSWNAFNSVSKITRVSPNDYTPKKDEVKKPDYINFRNW